MKKLFYTSTIILSAVLLWQRPVQAGTVFFDDMESGTNGWTATGLWHQQTDPQNIQIADGINTLVSLPDFGYLPNAYSDSTAWWYGSANDGTFMGDWTSANQTEKNGGLSDIANAADLISPSIDLSTVTDATLTFWHWWEVEGVDVDRYDLMRVYASTDGGTVWTEVASLNPANDVDGESFRPYSSGGLGTVGQWLYSTVDLTAYVGNTVQLKFNFDTVDERYNGFRGWLIDDVRVTDDATVKTSFDSQTTQATVACGGTSDGVITTPAQFYIQRAQAVQVTSGGNWYITPAGSDDYVATGTPGITSKVYLNAGFFELWVNFTDEQTCPDALMQTADASFYGGPGQPSAQMGTVVTFYGDNFVPTSTVQLAASTSVTSVMATTEVETVVVSSTEMQVTIPYAIDNGTYNLKVTQPNGKTTVLADAVIITSDTPPDITSVSPTEIDDAIATNITITGTGFVDGAVATVGGLPVVDAVVTDTTITGVVPVGGAAGYQNLVVINPDGQVAKLVGGVYIDDNAATGYTPAGEALTAPATVTGIVIAPITKKNAKVQWEAVDGAVTYVIQLQRGNTIVRTIESTDTKEKIKNLKSHRKYKVQIQAYNSYLGGALSKVKKFTTK